MLTPSLSISLFVRSGWRGRRPRRLGREKSEFRKLRGFDPASECHQFECSQSHGRLAHQRHLRGRSRTYFCNRVSQQRSNVELPLLCRRVGRRQSPPGRYFGELIDLAPVGETELSGLPIVEHEIVTSRELRKQFLGRTLLGLHQGEKLQDHKLFVPVSGWREAGCREGQAAPNKFHVITVPPEGTNKVGAAETIDLRAELWLDAVQLR